MADRIANAFAKALDQEDYTAAHALLAPDCVYECRGEIHRGPDAIIQSYQSIGDSGKQEFDDIAYESHVVAKSDTVATICFTDHVSHGEHRLTFRCEQEIEVGRDGTIVRIHHIDLPGQVQALKSFRSHVFSND